MTRNARFIRWVTFVLAALFLAPLTHAGIDIAIKDSVGAFIDTMQITEMDPPPPDIIPPTPNPMKFDSAPSPVDWYKITMTAKTASDPSGVEYSFECVLGGGHNSGWQPGTIYVDTSLQPGTTYTYQVRARDLSGNLNTTGWSGTGLRQRWYTQCTHRPTMAAYLGPVWRGLEL
jgi:hypothetical protein